MPKYLQSTYQNNMKTTRTFFIFFRNSVEIFNCTPFKGEISGTSPAPLHRPADMTVDFRMGWISVPDDPLSFVK